MHRDSERGIRFTFAYTEGSFTRCSHIIGTKFHRRHQRKCVPNVVVRAWCAGAEGSRPDVSESRMATQKSGMQRMYVGYEVDCVPEAGRWA